MVYKLIASSRDTIDCQVDVELVTSRVPRSASISCTIWEAARATSAAPIFFPSIKFAGQSGGEYIDAGVGCNNPTEVLLKEARSYYKLKKYKTTQPTCLVSIGTGQKDLIQLQRASSAFWFKDRTGLSIASVLGEIVTDCENTHDKVTLACLDNGIADRYYRFNVPQGMQNIVLDEWDKADDIKTYTDRYLRLNQTEHELLSCAERLYTNSDRSDQMESSETIPGASHRGQLRITQGDNIQHGSNTFSNSQVFQGNFIGHDVMTRG